MFEHTLSKNGEYAPLISKETYDVVMNVRPEILSPDMWLFGFMSTSLLSVPLFWADSRKIGQ